MKTLFVVNVFIGILGMDDDDDVGYIMQIICIAIQ